MKELTGKTTVARSNALTIFHDPTGTYSVRGNRGGVVSKVFDGVYTSRRAAQLAIERYNRIK